MAKKKSLEQEQDVYGQIFDFIFKQAEKKPEKRKPIKPTGLSGKDILVDSLAATLERPGAFITTQTAKDINDSLDFLSREVGAEVIVYEEPTYDPQNKSRNAIPYTTSAARRAKIARRCKRCNPKRPIWTL